MSSAFADIAWNCKSRKTGYTYKASVNFSELYVFDRGGQVLQHFEKLDYKTYFDDNEYAQYDVENRFTKNGNQVFSIFSKNNRMLTGLFGNDNSLDCRAVF